MSRNAPVICLGVLIAINIAMTAGLYFREPQAEPESDRIAVRIKASPDERRGVVEDFSGRIVERYPPRGRVPEAALPPSLDSELVDEIALQIVENYNSKDYAAIHELFDEIAKAEVTRDELEEQLRAAAGKFGQIDSHEFAGFVDSDFRGHEAHELLYYTGLPDSSFSWGAMTLGLLSRDGDLRLFSFALEGQPN